MYALFCMSLCYKSIKSLEILLEGTDGLQLSYNEGDASKFTSLERRYVGILNGLLWADKRWTEYDRTNCLLTSLYS